MLVVTVVIADHFFPLDLTRYNTQSLEVRASGGEVLHVSTTPDGMWRLGAEPEAVDPQYLAMLLKTEDRRFWWHPGIDPLALGRAAWQLVTRGHIVSGGSTLTMQVARLLTPHRHDVGGKLFDISRALQLEAHYSKRDILSMYLTLAPFGGNIEGVRAATLIYFDREAGILSDDQAALLVALPRSPARLRPDRHFERAVTAERKVLQKFKPDAAALDLAVITRHALPRRAPYFADRLRGMHRSGPVKTTFDAGLQGAVEDLARREKPYLGDKASIAVLIVRNSDRAVMAYLGGVDYWGPGGMVDMMRAKRSPGSTLKPFIYGMAFDDVLILPDTLIDDAPLRIGDYAPQNITHDFHGTVSVREALQQSYNLPAVELLSQVGPERFAAALRQVGTRLEFPRGMVAASLPIALGGVGISLEDLTSLYVGLADQGRVTPLRYLAADPAAPGEALMTREAAAKVGDILRGTPRPDGVSMLRPRPVAYKTGTSYGFRDAWSAGYTSGYTIAVWIGRVEGSPRPGAFGRNTAAPLLFKLFDLLPAEAEEPAAKPAKEGKGRVAPSLKRYAPRSATLTNAPTPKIMFPPTGATLDFDEDARPIALEAAGGTPPYRWAVNGVPLPVEAVGTTVSWKPNGPGFARLSVTDHNNQTASASVRLQ